MKGIFKKGKKGNNTTRMSYCSVKLPVTGGEIV